MLNPIVEIRRQNKLRLYELLRNEGELSAERLIALFSLQTGLRRRTVLEYVDELIEAGLIDECKRVHTKDEPERLRRAHKPSKYKVADDKRKARIVKAAKPKAGH